MPFDSVGDLLPLLILLIPVIQWLRQLFRGDREPVTAAPADAPGVLDTPPARPAPVRPPPREPRTLRPRSADAAVALDLRPSRPVTAPPIAVRRAPGVDYRAALRSQATARHAMVLMTILGPCRAMQPFGAREPQ